MGLKMFKGGFLFANILQSFKTKYLLKEKGLDLFIYLSAAGRVYTDQKQ